MKFFLVACAIVVAVQGLTDDAKEKQIQYDNECMEEIGISEDVVKKAHAGDAAAVKDPKLSPFTYCVIKKIGIIDDSGNFKDEVIMAMTEEKEKPQAMEALEKCKAKVGKVNEQNAFAMCQCFHELAPSIM